MNNEEMGKISLPIINQDITNKQSLNKIFL